MATQEYHSSIHLEYFLLCVILKGSPITDTTPVMNLVQIYPLYITYHQLSDTYKGLLMDTEVVAFGNQIITEIRDQCRVAGVAFFFKQWGGANKKRAGRLLEGRTWDEMPRNNVVTVARGVRG